MSFDVARSEPPDVRRERGFTLIELMVVTSILMVLAALTTAQYKNSVVRSKEATLKTDLFRIREGIDEYFADKGFYPATLDTLVSEGYLRRLQADPFTQSSATWQIVPSEPDPSNPSAPSGVYDVKSGSDATALDGSRYADW
jgi:general secretion pathway protein G